MSNFGSNGALLKRPALQVSSNDAVAFSSASGLQPAHVSLQHSTPDSAGGVTGPGSFPTRSAMAGGDGASGQVEDAMFWNAERQPQILFCDYAVGPVVVTPDSVWERRQDHTGSMSNGDIANPPSSCYVLGRSVHQFAPAVAASSDGEETVNSWHKAPSVFGTICLFYHLYEFMHRLAKQSVIIMNRTARVLVHSIVRQRTGDGLFRNQFLSLRFKYRSHVP